MPKSELELALGSEPVDCELPAELPLAHLTVARCLKNVLELRSLTPRHCKVFDENLLYFSYGGVFYRTSKLQSENASELPVAMVFSPEVFDQASKLFPFDSGAMKNRLFGNDWFSSFEPFEDRFSVADDGLSQSARLLIHHLYSTNARYVEGRPRPRLTTTTMPLELLHNFLKQDLSQVAQGIGGIDHRQRSIEVITRANVPLAEQLLWIGFPEFKTNQTLRALRVCTGRRIPQIYTYRYSRNFNPDALADRLQEAAYEQVIGRYTK